MKKEFLLMFILPIIFFGCSNDEDSKDSLNGTTWEYIEGDSEGLIFISTIRFSKETFTYSGYEQMGTKKYDFSGSGTYTYEKPYVYMIEDGEEQKGIVSRNTITMIGEDEFVYIKK